MRDASVVDELMANAWPPQVVESVGSWRYRWASGVTRRANSVLAIGEAGDVDELIARARAVLQVPGCPCAVPRHQCVDAKVTGR
ncbi:MAG: hypothetical protein ACRDZN_15630 [Acidimicrobiales bacterium]